MDTVLIGLDVGSTGIRAAMVRPDGSVFRQEYRRLVRREPQPGASEYDPEEVWQAALGVLNALMLHAGPDCTVAGLGISVQRSTFCLVDRGSGKAVTPFYSWADTRSVGTVERMNRSFLWNLIRVVTGIAAFFTGSVFFKAVSMFRFSPVHSSCRLRWVFDVNPGLEQRSKKGELLFSTVDTWLVYRLTGGSVAATDVSSAASTSLYNHFNFSWNSLFCSLFRIPLSIFPEVKETAGQYGEWKTETGLTIPIGAVCGDQMASMFANGCFSPGDAKVTLGSGGFVTVMMGEKPRLSRRGLFPLLVWKIGGRAWYMLEGQVTAVGTIIDWVDKGLGLAASARELDDLVNEAGGSGEVTVLPTPHGIGFPHFYDRLKSAVFGLSLSTTKGEVAYALYEGIALAVHDILVGIQKDTGTKVHSLKVDGGVSRSAALMGILADVLQTDVFAAKEPEMSTVGAALLGGIGTQVLNFEDIHAKGLDQKAVNEKYYTCFHCRSNTSYRDALVERWHRALRSLVRNH
ncbi:MAG: glycerol kinase [Spirochaetales bacterium]|nr:glycerol kinase [Spirochaetales bacterium]